MTKIVITGEEGVGKSLMGFAISKALQEMVGHDLEGGFLPPLPVERITFEESKYLAKYFQQKILTNKNVKVVWVDEAVDLLHAKEHMAKYSREFVKVMRKIRKEKKHFIIVSPHIYDVNRDIRERAMTFWIHFIDKKDRVKNVAVVLRGFSAKYELEYHIKHVQAMLERYGVWGWFLNKYYLFSVLVEYDRKLDKEYEELFKKKREELEKYLFIEGDPWEKFYQLLQERSKWMKAPWADDEEKVLVMAKRLKIETELKKVKEILKQTSREWIMEAIKELKKPSITKITIKRNTQNNHSAP